MIRFDTGNKVAYHIKEAAKLIGVSPITLKRWLLSGKFSDVKRDRNGWRIFEDDEISYFKRLAERTCSPDFIRSKPVSVASFFSGIGGLDLGFETAGFNLNFQCEINPFCLNILEKHWPNLPKWCDIRSLNSAAIPLSDVWVGGFPCQDLSLARMGKRAGLRGVQSGLFYEFARLVGEGCPRFVVIENVAGLLNSHRGADFAVVISTLAKLGYAVGWRTFNSRYFGVPQSRQRVYIIASYRDWRGPSAVLFEPQCSEGHPSSNKVSGQKSESPFKKVIGDISGKGPVIQSIAYCLYACSARHTGTDWSRNYVCYPKHGKVRRLTPKECEGVMGFPEGWTIPVNGVFKNYDLDSLRYHALGNAVTPPVAGWIADKIKAYLADSTQKESC
jgi:DNA (cytosine-5)-methyltransferase 1